MLAQPLAPVIFMQSTSWLPSSMPFPTGLTKLVNVLAAGELPEEDAPDFCGARLYAGNKKSGGVRPIAVGNILRRLVSKCFSFGLSDKAARLLAPL